MTRKFAFLPFFEEFLRNRFIPPHMPRAICSLGRKRFTFEKPQPTGACKIACLFKENRIEPGGLVAYCGKRGMDMGCRHDWNLESRGTYVRWIQNILRKG